MRIDRGLGPAESHERRGASPGDGIARRALLRGMAGIGALALYGVIGPAARALDRDGPAPTEQEQVAAAHRAAVGMEFEPLELPLDVWRRRLSPEAFDVLFREATERPNSSPLDDEARAGVYVCAACHLPLFLSDTKFDSGTGWPSFTAPIPERVDTRADDLLVFPRTEYHCARCGGHQGHVFEDGPPPTGQRWCNNGVALRFVPADEPLPELVQAERVQGSEEAR